MNGTEKRGFKLKNVRMTLSKLDAKYSKPSVQADEDLSDFDGDQVKQTPPPTSLFPKVESDTDLEVYYKEKEQEQRSNSDSSQKLRLTLSPERAPAEQEGSPEDDTSIDSASSIESVKTDSILGFNNIHSVSSLADSILRSEEKDQKISVLTAIPKSASPSKSSSAATAGIDYESIISNEDKSKPVDNTSSASSLKQIQKPMSQLLENFVENTNDQILERTDSTEEEALVDASTIHKQAEGNNVRYTEKNSLLNTTARKKHSRENSFCKCNKVPKPERKSIAVQTLLDHQGVESCNFKNDAKGISTMEHIKLKATKLPRFLNDIPAPATKVGSEKCLRSEASGFTFDHELSELVSQHLYLTKEFLERQHRMYIANCKAVQLFEKGYRENGLQGI